MIDILGGDVDAFTGKEYTSFYAHVLDEQVPTALDLLTDVVTSPRFSEEDVEMERGVILEEGSLTAHVTIVARAMGVPASSRIDVSFTGLSPVS